MKPLVPLDDFWLIIDDQIAQLQKARTADDVMRILATGKNPYGDPKITPAPAFFAGSGGDKTVISALLLAGWTVAWSRASYWYAMTAPDGSSITYTEGDIERGDAR